MSEEISVTGSTKEERYQSLIPQVRALVKGEKDFVANISNIIAALKYGMNFMWVGVYFVKPSPQSFEEVLRRSPFGQSDLRFSSGREEQELVLGPFQGPIACTRIAFGKGVCGTAWKEKKTMMVEDVGKFPDHIVCSSEAKSEIVVPCFKKGTVVAVLDIDSDKLSGFDETDKKYLEQIVEIIEQLP